MKRINLRWVAICVLALGVMPCIVGCSKKSDKDEEIDTRIDDVVPEEIQERLNAYMTIYRGVNPPNIEGCYLLDDPEVVFCEDEDDGGYEPGETGFVEEYIRFSNQDMKKNTVDYEELDDYSEQSGEGAFISGDGNDFTAYFNTTGTYDGIYGIYIKTALVISGTKTSSGIENLRYAFIMVEKGDDPDEYLMDEGVFRVFKDSDEIASPATWPSTSSSDLRAADMRTGKRHSVLGRNK